MIKNNILLDYSSTDGGGMSEQEFQGKVLRGVETLAGDIKRLKEESNRHSGLINTLKSVRGGSHGLPAVPGKVSDDCARFIGAVALVCGLKGGQIVSGKAADFAAGFIKDATGIEVRTALTSSDIPLPVEYQGDVVEMVGLFGNARKFATVLPLGSGSVKLPRLKTDPAFGLIVGSGTVTEKSPQTEWVTFTPEKFGGLVRVPSEMDEDSIVGIGQFLARYAARQMAYLEDWQVFRSTGAGSGINGTAEGLTKSVVTNSKTTVSGVLGSPSEFTLTHFRTLRTVCDAAALRTGAYYLHPSFETLLATFNTSGNKPYNPQAQISGSGANPMLTGPTLDGFPIRWVDVMPVYTTSDALSTVHVLFGDVSFQYLGIRGGMRFDTSAEAGFTTDEILVRALERMTTGLMATGAVGGLITHSA
jgi:HK97 family phage major capsid protein